MKENYNVDPFQLNPGDESIKTRIKTLQIARGFTVDALYDIALQSVTAPAIVTPLEMQTTFLNSCQRTVLAIMNENTVLSIRNHDFSS